MMHRQTVARGVAAVVAGMSAAGSMFLGAGPARADSDPPAGPEAPNIAVGMALSLVRPKASPPGANDWSCRPTARHPEPVVLLLGSFTTAYSNYARLAPALKREGYCVFSPNYGGWFPGSPFQALQHLPDEAVFVSGYVDKVLAATRAAKVDLVGHSSGGLLSRVYLKYAGGRDKVAKVIGLGAPSHGSLPEKFSDVFLSVTGIALPFGVLCGACLDQSDHDDFIKKLNTPAETYPEIEYTEIATKLDEISIPYTNSFLAPGPNVVNQTVQDSCPLDLNEHLNLTYDPVAIRLTLNALDPSSAQQPTC